MQGVSLFCCWLLTVSRYLGGPRPSQSASGKFSAALWGREPNPHLSPKPEAAIRC